MKHTKRIVEGYSMEEAFKTLNEKSNSKAKDIVKSKKATSRKLVEGSGVSDAARNRGLDQLFDAVIRRALMDSQADFEPIDSDVAFSGWVETLAGELFSEYFLDGKEFSGASLSKEEDAYLEDINKRVAKVANKLLGTSYKLVEEAKSRKVGKRVVEDASVQVPAPYNKYFEVVSPAEIDFVDGMYEIGDLVAGVKILAYLVAKDAYADIFDDAFLVNDSSMPVVSIVRDRVYPVDLSEVTEAKSSKVGK